MTRARMAMMLAGVAVGACGGQSFSCQDDAACDGGWCEAQGWCSFADDACDSGRRFGEHAGVGLAGQCVEPVGGASSGSDDGAITLSSGDASSSSEGSTGSPPDPITGGETTLPVDGSTSTPADSTSASDTSTGGPAIVHVGPLSIAANEDDGQMFQDGPGITWLPSGEPGLPAFAGEYPVGARYFGYFRFALPIEIPADATIENAVLSLYGEPPYNWRNGDYQMGVWVQDTADAIAVQMPAAMPVIGGAGDDEIALRSEVVAWPEDGPLPWTVGDWNETPDLGPLLTAHVAARGGLASGAHVQIWIAMYEPVGASAEISFVDYAGDPRLAARLELDVAQP
jgi:hypothetical protein